MSIGTSEMSAMAAATPTTSSLGEAEAKITGWTMARMPNDLRPSTVFVARDLAQDILMRCL
eukprot:3035628-Pyramimonas_sp.AAC.1